MNRVRYVTKQRKRLLEYPEERFCGAPARSVRSFRQQIGTECGRVVEALRSRRNARFFKGQTPELNLL